MKHHPCFAACRRRSGRSGLLGAAFILLVLLFASLSLAAADLTPGSQEYQDWEERSLKTIAELRKHSDKDSYGELVIWVYRMSQTPNRESGEGPVFSAAREALLSLPDHAEYFRQSIEASIRYERAEISNNRRDEPKPEERYYTFEVMGQLRSPACIALLGDYLADERDPWKDVPPSDCSYPSSNRSYALGELEKMGIEGSYPRPPQSLAEFEDRVSRWKIWTDQVRAGIRSYRFKGDPQNYLITGPVAAEVIPPMDMSQPFLPWPDPDEVAWIAKRRSEKAAEDWREFIKDTVRHPTPQTVMELAKGPRISNLDKQSSTELWRETRSARDSIPQYMDFIESQIRSNFDDEVRAAASPNLKTTGANDESTPSSWVSRRLILYDFLSDQRTPECVNMLCKFLDDNRNPWGCTDHTEDIELRMLPAVFDMGGRNTLQHGN